ncbi:MAG: PAS-domain containing protein [Rhodospirillales bacterium]|nr:PAS-domain containing protein [Rhodospirillales bacterium]
MSDTGQDDAPWLAAVLNTLPTGVAVFDSRQRARLINPAYYASLGLPPDTYPRGTTLAEMMRGAALRGVLGPGDPEVLAREALAVDRTRPGLLRRRHFGGRVFDLHNQPLPDGGHVVCAVDSTALLAARDEAESSLARLGVALSSLRIGLASFAPDRTLILHNPRFAMLLGLPGGQMHRGLAFERLLEMMERGEEFVGPDGQRFIAAERAMDRARPASARHFRASGQVLDIASDPVGDGGWTITVTDLTPLVQAQDESRRRAGLLRSILEAIPHGVCMFDPDRRVALVNAAYNTIMAGAEVVVGEPMEALVRRRVARGEFGPGDPERLIAEQLAFDVTRPQMRRRRRPNGTMIDIRTTPLPHGGHISVLTDITPLTEAEAALAGRAEAMKVMLASIRHGITLWDAAGRLVAANRIAAELLGVSAGVLVPGCHHGTVLDGLFPAGAPCEAWTGALRTAAGRDLEARADPTPDGGCVVTLTDVTESRASEHALRTAKLAAEQANQAKSRFLATMSHELRTPLHSVIGYSDALLREASGPAAARIAEFAQQINESGKHLLGLINIILDVARIEAGRFTLASDTVDLGRLVQAAIRQTAATAAAAEVGVEAAVAPGLPPLRADERRLAQVLDQLLANAVKFTPPGGQVTVGAALAPGGTIRIWVQDTGIGIPESERERVFEPFTQLDSSLSRRFPGAGLGLYICRALVEGHGGRLSLEPAPGGGTIATIQLSADRLVRPDRVPPARQETPP